jgi:PKD repeat protein
VINGIGVFTVPSSSFEQPDTIEFVMRSLTMTSGASVTYSGADNLVIAALHDLNVGTGTSVNVDGLGQQGGGPDEGGSGPGAGDHSILGNCADAGGGGSFGGLGGDGGNGVPSGAMYGTTDQSQFLNQGSGGGGAGSGSGCGVVNGGSGGGGLGLIAMGTLTVNGSVSANGTPPGPTASLTDQGGPGGGSGGAILLMSPHLVLANESVASAKGGTGYSTSVSSGSGGGGGGGGRITMVSDQPSSAINFLNVGGGLGGVTTGGGLGLDGGEGNSGSIAGLPFLKVSGPASKQTGQTASFTVTKAFGDATFSWDFGDGRTGTAPTHIYTAPGTYTVTVTATLTDSGQTATAQRSITITQAPGTSPVITPTIPPTIQPPVIHCVVPKLKGLSLSKARRKLAHAHCTLGKVKKPKTRKSAKKKPTLVVARQSPAAGKQLASGSRVNVTLAAKKPKRHKHH